MHRRTVARSVPARARLAVAVDGRDPGPAPVGSRARGGVSRPAADTGRPPRRVPTCGWGDRRVVLVLLEAERVVRVDLDLGSRVRRGRSGRRSLVGRRRSTGQAGRPGAPAPPEPRRPGVRTPAARAPAGPRTPGARTPEAACGDRSLVRRRRVRRRRVRRPEPRRPEARTPEAAAAPGSASAGGRGAGAEPARRRRRQPRPARQQRRRGAPANGPERSTATASAPR